MPAVPTPVPPLDTPLPDPSDRTTYGPRGRAVWEWEVNTLVPGVNAVGAAAYENAVAAEDAALSASAAANFKGAWSAQVGALNKPAAVSHSGTVWALLNNLANVATSQPGVSADWVDIGGVKRTGDTMVGALSVPAGATGTQVPQAQEVPLLATTQLGFRNRAVNGNFAINQRAVSGTVVLAAGAYGHDQWKAGAAGCTYTFATTEGITTLTITAGSLIQPIEGASLRTGTHVLSWAGTAQGKIGAGSYAASGVTGAVTGGADTPIEFNTGTVSLVQLEPGTRPSQFEFLDPTTDFNRCCRYFWAGAVYWSGQATTSGRAGAQVRFPVRMRAAPTMGGYVSTALSGFAAGNPTSFGLTVDGVTLDKVANATFSDGRWAYTFTASALLP